MLQRGNGGISGEVYWVPEPCWPALDDWEEVPEVYQRSSVTLGMAAACGSMKRRRNNRRSSTP